MDLTRLMSVLNQGTKAEIQAIVDDLLPDWAPLPGQQTLAYDSEADELFYGGAAGGAKSDLLLGLGLPAHDKRFDLTG